MHLKENLAAIGVLLADTSQQEEAGGSFLATFDFLVDLIREGTRP